MQEEFHAEVINGTKVYKRLYGWNSLSANVWLPSLCELVGYSGTEDPRLGTYVSAMQGLNASTLYWGDPKGGEQFAYFAQYNLSGGGQKLWLACNQQQSWLRSPVEANATHGRILESATRISWDTDVPVTASHAVRQCKFHISSDQIPYLSLIPKGQGKSLLTPLYLLSPQSIRFAGTPEKRHARLTCSVVNALSMVRTYYHLFVGKGILQISLSSKKRRIITKREKEVFLLCRYQPISLFFQK